MIPLIPRAPAQYDQANEQQFRGVLERDAATNLKKNEPLDGPLYLKSYVKTALPSAAISGGLIYVSNDTGGAVPAFSDGTNWRRVTDRNVIS